MTTTTVTFQTTDILDVIEAINDRIETLDDSIKYEADPEIAKPLVICRGALERALGAIEEATP